MNVQLKKGVLEMMILCYIAEQDNYGYSIYQFINEKFIISESTVYPVLRKLVTQKYCMTYLQESRAGPARKYFTITAVGLRAVKAQQEEWFRFTKIVDSIVLKETEHE